VYQIESEMWNGSGSVWIGVPGVSSKGNVEGRTAIFIERETEKRFHRTINVMSWSQVCVCYHLSEKYLVWNRMYRPLGRRMSSSQLIKAVDHIDAEKRFSLIFVCTDIVHNSNIVLTYKFMEPVELESNEFILSLFEWQFLCGIFDPKDFFFFCFCDWIAVCLFWLLWLNFSYLTCLWCLKTWSVFFVFFFILIFFFFFKVLDFHLLFALSFSPFSFSLLDLEVEFHTSGLANEILIIWEADNRSYAKRQTMLMQTSWKK